MSRWTRAFGRRRNGLRMTRPLRRSLMMRSRMCRMMTRRNVQSSKPLSESSSFTGAFCFIGDGYTFLRKSPDDLPWLQRCSKKRSQLQRIPAAHGEEYGRFIPLADTFPVWSVRKLLERFDQGMEAAHLTGSNLDIFIVTNILCVCHTATKKSDKQYLMFWEGGSKSTMIQVSIVS